MNKLQKLFTKDAIEFIQMLARSKYQGMRLDEILEVLAQFNITVSLVEKDKD